ncbi:hypothetical protein [Streptomyces sp. NPDC049906]|uniref:hypothetical protein n=1 Tax=Streptomyces sp. NPDC049906 TaxID=3155656 RepID=UPI00343EC764
MATHLEVHVLVASQQMRRGFQLQGPEGRWALPHAPVRDGESIADATARIIRSTLDLPARRARVLCVDHAPRGGPDQSGVLTFVMDGGTLTDDLAERVMRHTPTPAPRRWATLDEFRDAAPVVHQALVMRLTDRLTVAVLTNGTSDVERAATAYADDPILLDQFRSAKNLNGQARS